MLSSILWNVRCVGTKLGRAVNVFRKPPPTHLPQKDNDLGKRRKGLDHAKKIYQLDQKDFGFVKTGEGTKEVDLVNIPPMLKTVPCKETYYFYDLRFAAKFLFYQIYESLQGEGSWTLDEIISHFRHSRILTKPKGLEVWLLEDVNNLFQTQKQMAQADYWFAWQRMNGVTRNLIKLIDYVPTEFLPVESELGNTHPYLGDKTLHEVAKENKLYIVDLTDVALGQENWLCPVALFSIYNGKLMPIAIHAKLEEKREIFIPPPFKADHVRHQRWVKAKMWFNMLDAQYHESITHLGFTHLIMDGVSVSLHRNVSERHPVFKLMAPHFRHMHDINNIATTTLLSKDGFVDRDMSYGRKNMLNLIGRHNQSWSLNKQGSFEWDLENRGVKTLPGYYFREDALKIHDAIRAYVSDYIKLYYDEDDTLKSDEEMQAFRKQLLSPRSLKGNGGCGMQGVPDFDTIENLSATLTSFIFICSVEHSATNFPQYDQYGFAPNYAAKLNGFPEEQFGSQELVAALPSKREFFSTVKIMKVLTTVLTNNLGNYEKEYMQAMDTRGREAVKKFQQALQTISKDIDERNELIRQENAKPDCQVQDYTYTWLHPDKVLNSISI